MKCSIVPPVTSADNVLKQKDQNNLDSEAIDSTHTYRQIHADIWTHTDTETQTHKTHTQLLENIIFKCVFFV